MKFEFFIARRYLQKRQKNSFISIISLVSIIGITIGVAALIIALALITGFQSEIQGKILSSTAHILISSAYGDGFAGYDKIIETIKKKNKEIVSAAPVVYGTVLLKGSSRDASGAILRGMDMVITKDEIWQKKIIRGELPLKKNELLVGNEIANKVVLMEDDTCTVVAPQLILSPTGFVPKIKKMRISGIFKTGLYEMDNGTIITNLETGQKLFDLKNKISYIQVFLKDLFMAEEVKDRLVHMLPAKLSVITWKELNAGLYSALKLEKTVLFFTLTLIIVVASLNIIAGLILLVFQKIKDIGILLSYGASPRTIRRIFFIQGSIIGLVGTFCGVVLGLAVCVLANKFELIKVPSEIYQMSYLPFRLGLLEFFAVVGVALLISLTATIIPSRKAAAVNVVDAIKNE